jgi:outer membrane protein assembly factor BamB
MENRRLLALSLALLGFSSPAIRAEDWPGFRGPGHQGESAENNLPLRWDTQTNVAWKTPIPGEGWSSPIIWGNRVFVTTATDNGASCHVLCLNRHNGRILWDKETFRQVPSRKEGKNSYATPTPVTDGRRVYTVFGDGSFVALTFDGEVAWVNRDFPYYSQHGLGASPILFEDLLIMSRDASSETGEKRLGWQIPWDRSFLVALDARTGKVRWKTGRGMSRIGHTTPNIDRQGSRPIVISSAGDVVQGFDARTGEKLWWIASKGEGVVPSPVLGGGMAFTASGFEKPTTRAVRLGGAGDVTATHIAWEQTKSVSMIPSFVYVSPWLFSVTTNGIACCVDGRTGEIVWQSRVSGDHSASPVYAGGHIYFLSEQGETTVVKAGPAFELVARNPLNETVQASMAVSQGRFFIRTDRNLYCIGR